MRMMMKRKPLLKLVGIRDSWSSQCCWSRDLQGYGMKHGCSLASV
jgi:hypothetical protein